MQALQVLTPKILNISLLKNKYEKQLTRSFLGAHQQKQIDEIEI